MPHLEFTPLFRLKDGTQTWGVTCADYNFVVTGKGNNWHAHYSHISTPDVPLQIGGTYLDQYQAAVACTRLLVRLLN